MKMNFTLACYCLNHCPGNEQNGTCTTVGDGRCFSQVEQLRHGSDEVKLTKGCTPPETGSVFQCKAKRHYLRKVIECCDTDFCNYNVNPQLPSIDETPTDASDSNDTLYLGVTICCVILSCALVIAALFTFYLAWKRKNEPKELSLLQSLKCKFQLSVRLNDWPGSSITDMQMLKEIGINSSSSMKAEGGNPGISTLQALIDSSGSGKGVPLLVQMTISRQFSFIKQIGEGGFGSVWKATWFGDPIAVKIFSTREEDSWKREKEIYQTNLLRHDNILGFIAADIGGTGTSTQMLLIMEYHEYGSLYDFLQNRYVDVPLMLRLMHSILSGLSHLHNEIIGSEGKEQGQLRGSQRKPPIAHRDLKSKNILVKSNLTCCIADLGHCARYVSDQGHIDIGHQTGLVGTKRYMPPEVLSGSMDRSRFEAYKSCDMYNTSLILWEIANCADCNGCYQPYSYPFQDVLPSDPSVEDVYQVVCVSRMRPALPGYWVNEPIFRTVARIICECWSEDWHSRQSSLRVKKSLANLINQSQQTTTPLTQYSSNVNNEKFEQNTSVVASDTAAAMSAALQTKMLPQNEESLV